MTNNLRNDCVMAQTREIEYSFETNYTFWEAVGCEGCGKVVVMEDGSPGAVHASIFAEDTECHGWIPSAEGPGMNYFCPLVGNPDPFDAATKIAHLPLCIVQIGDEYGLALTGGGMDMTWQIAEAYIVLGYLPPMSHTRLPMMAGMKLDKRNKEIVAACQQTNKIVKLWADAGLRDLRNTVEWMRQEAKK